ncbi:oligoendopeptidase F [Thermonema lapsum]|uniref:Oligoendopeptidase F n=1 Tax=Thermonema lapsum TaxID=28195 RepID=A0A846MMA7_9BACT|nr:M3 family oligoendopeptidase [Thermonema lapsum]NIK72614.1 oligoendopeptidase F [Thermonema lapsum]
MASFVDNTDIRSAADIIPYYEELLKRPINDLEGLKRWFRHRDELEAQIAESLGWTYIRYTCNTADPEAKRAFEHFVEEIQPVSLRYTQKLNRKAFDSPFVNLLAQEPGYHIYLKRLRKQIDLFQEKNIPLITRVQVLQQEYSKIAGAMTVSIDGKELTLQQAQDLLFDPNRNKREEAYVKIAERRLKDCKELNELLDELIALRHQIATQAGYANYRDYIWDELCRFDYTPSDCLQMHRAVAQHAVPLLDDLANERQRQMGVRTLKPWDWKTDPLGRPPLYPFSDEKDLIEKTKVCLEQIHPFFAECLNRLHEAGRLDLSSRKNKAPGGYNYPLPVSNLPFIFMNASGSLRDVTTLLHEMGHAVHSILMADLPLAAFKEVPSEVAELASMSMELITMPAWEAYLPQQEELQRAYAFQKQEIIETLPWVACIDAFQHWLYTNPKHNHEQRRKAWHDIYSRFHDKLTDWHDLEEYHDYLWQKQLHIYEVPFYYIEYGIAQLGALALWQNYRKAPATTLQSYLDALKIGYTHSIPDIYATAGIRFDFSEAYIQKTLQAVEEI